VPAVLREGLIAPVDVLKDNPAGVAEKLIPAACPTTGDTVPVFEREKFGLKN
jgi:hypothetical protein